MLVISPERKIKLEQFVVKDFKCPVCNGRKQFHNEVGRDKIESTDCTFCQGIGSLLCEVQLTWKPNDDCS